MEVEFRFHGVHEILRRLYLRTRELHLLFVTHGPPLASELGCLDLKRPESTSVKQEQLENFRSPFTLNGNIEKRH